MSEQMNNVSVGSVCGEWRLKREQRKHLDLRACHRACVRRWGAFSSQTLLSAQYAASGNMSAERERHPKVEHLLAAFQCSVSFPFILQMKVGLGGRAEKSFYRLTERERERITTTERESGGRVATHQHEPVSVLVELVL